MEINNLIEEINKLYDPAREETNLTKAIACSLKILILQIYLSAGEDNEGFEARLIDPFSLGYIFGYSGGRLASYGIEDDSDKIKALLTIFSHIFNKTFKLDHQKILKMAILYQENNDSNFLLGQNFGWNQMESFFRHNKYPGGLTEFLLDGIKP